MATVISTQPPKYYLPLESMDTVLGGAPSLHDPEVAMGSDVIGRDKAGSVAAGITGESEHALAAGN